MTINEAVVSRPTKIILFGLLLLSIWSLGSIVAQSGGGSGNFFDSGLTNGVGPWHLMQGVVNCRISGVFDGASVSVEYLYKGTQASPVTINDVSVSALVGVTVETADIRMEVGKVIRANVSGGLGLENIDVSCWNVD